MKLLIGENLQLWRGELHVLRGLSLAVDAGCCLQVTGINGAGKSSLLRVLAGLLPAEEGSVSWRGIDTRGDQHAYHSELAWLGHGTALKADLSARENLRYSAGLRRELDSAQIDAALARVGFAHADQRLARQMSAGQQRRVALARVLLLDCALWLLDEPTSNLDSSGQRMFTQLLEAHLDEGGLAVVATHQPLAIDPQRLQTLELA
ncbi:MAG TPA: cytochrome c biogenesis heme-transporting ATPase CcmA [Steroidobacteraceae bacterium]|nr:cytochrome c biogenesis heme-transporting ATPase CcmA [Steroidobacteraceae bacterium]